MTKRLTFTSFILLSFIVSNLFSVFNFPFILAQSEGPSIKNITIETPQAPKYDKFEVTFQVDTIAENLQLPYDETPPAGIEPKIGISVDAFFTPDNWQTVYTQPAFYYQEFLDEVKSGNEWFYPTGSFFWKVRFAPNEVGTWQFKLRAQDSSGTTETQPQSFTVVSSDNKGFIRVSENDARYFEFDDGTYFPGLGYNMNYDHVNWINPVLDNQENFQKMDQNGIQLVRIWLSEWGIYGSAWNPWNAIEPQKHGMYIPLAGLAHWVAHPESELSMELVWNHSWFSSCMFIGAWKAPPAVKRNTEYRVRVRYRAYDLGGPRITGNSYGFVAKTGGWLWGDSNYCYDPGTGNVIAATYSGNWQNYPDPVDLNWNILEGTLNSGSSDYLPYFYLALENVTSGSVYIDDVSIEGNLGDGTYGPNIVSKPDMDHHLYMEQRNSYAFDKVMELAKQYNIYLRPVIHEKNEWIFNNMKPDGSFGGTETNDNFYGEWRTMTKARWLQQAWWRYLQARWGYSPNIHSWELLNEGDPWNSQHYTLTDEFGKYMHQFTPDDHLVSTSNWHSFPKDNFWANPEYPNVDFADYHKYESTSEDTAGNTNYWSMRYGAYQPEGAGKPVIRGETGFSDEVTQDSQGTWLHNYIWGGINPGGMLESYWYENSHIYTKDFDHRNQYGNYYNFIQDIPLNNGNYGDAQAVVSNNNLRVWGQKDLVNGQAHLWIQNKNHTWKNVVDGVSIPSQTGTITVSGFKPNKEFTVERWSTWQGAVSSTSSQTSNANGELSFQIDNLTSDLAIRVLMKEEPSPPSLTGDLNEDGVVDILDLVIVGNSFGKAPGDTGYDPRADSNKSGGVIDIFDLILVGVNFGKTR